MSDMADNYVLPSLQCPDYCEGITVFQSYCSSVGKKVSLKKVVAYRTKYEQIVMQRLATGTIVTHAENVGNLRGVMIRGFFIPYAAVGFGVPANICMDTDNWEHYHNVRRQKEQQPEP